MLEELLGKVKTDGIVVQEMVADKDSSVNATFCRHFPEGTLTYCSNHCTKTLHKSLKKNNCEVNIYFNISVYLLLKILTCCQSAR